VILPSAAFSVQARAVVRRGEIESQDPQFHSPKFEDLNPVFDRTESYDAQEHDAQEEVARLRRMGEIATRPKQAEFRTKLRDLYGQKCAVTECTTAEVLEAAHIHVKRDRDLNDLKNGILLRADIHALLDRGLITFSLDGSRIEIDKSRLTDPYYQFLSGREVHQPSDNAPSQEYILEHRRRFDFPM
jgi:predicted restriction endonuclease